MKSFKQYITEVERYEDDDSSWVLDILDLLVPGTIGGGIGTILTSPTTLGRDDQPEIFPFGNPPWHNTHPNNRWDNPPPGWYRIPSGFNDWKFRFVPKPKNGTFTWNPDGGYWQEIVGPPSPDDMYREPNVPLDPYGRPIIPGHPDFVFPNFDDIDWNTVTTDNSQNTEG